MNSVQNKMKQEDKNLGDFNRISKSLPLFSQIKVFDSMIQDIKMSKGHTYQRLVTSASGREVEIIDPYTNTPRKMLMFASNNYLGFANHPYVKQKVKFAIDKYGVGVGGPPLLNGYTQLMQELEERLADLKQQESAMIFSSGFATNLGLITALTKNDDIVIYDELSHASFYDGLRLANVRSVSFKHNDMEDLETKLKHYSKRNKGEMFVGFEGVYSMDGNLGPLDIMVPLIKKYKGISLLDDAHGTGVLGQNGSGTSEHFGVCKDVDIAMGTFSKAFSVTGGFLGSSREMIQYIRYYARPYVFSASLTAPTLAAVLAGIDLIQEEPWRRKVLLENTKYATDKLRKFGLTIEPEAAIIALLVPEWMDMRKVNYEIHKRDIFINAIEYPAVPQDQQRFRISIMAEHTKEDIDRLAGALDEIWNDEKNRLIPDQT